MRTTKMYSHFFLNNKLNSTHVSIGRYLSSIGGQISENKTIFHEKQLTYRKVDTFINILGNF